MMPYLTTDFGNAASRTHLYGWKAQEAVEIARHQIASLMGATDKEFVFTSGATEANNLAIKGVFEAYQSKGNHFITLQTEHKAILDTFQHLEQWGAKVTYLQPKSDGLITLEQIEEAIQPETVMVSLMYANNETGVILPIKKIGELCKEKKMLFHTDATQAVGKLPINVQEDNIDLMSFSAHKFYGPKGVGGLFVRRKDPTVKLIPILDGGKHERGMRSGTLNVPSIVGMAKALEETTKHLPAESKRLNDLRNRLEKSILSKISNTQVNGNQLFRLPHVSNISFGRLDGENLLLNLKDIAVSSGSACTSASVEPSHVLKAMGVADDLAYASIRFSLGKYTTLEEVDFAVAHIVEVVGRLRGI